MTIERSDLKSHAANLGALQNHHTREREALAATHSHAHAQLRKRHDDAQKRLIEHHRSRGTLDHPSVRDDEQEAKFRAGEHAKLEATHHGERQKMRERHVRELARPDGSLPLNSSPDRHSGPSGHGALGTVYSNLSLDQQAEMARLVAKHDAQKRNLEERHSGDEKRHGRYDHDASRRSSLDLRTNEFRKLLDRQSEEASALAARHQNENEARQRHGDRQAAERQDLENKHRREAKAS